MISRCARRRSRFAPKGLHGRERYRFGSGRKIATTDARDSTDTNNDAGLRWKKSTYKVQNNHIHTDNMATFGLVASLFLLVLCRACCRCGLPAVSLARRPLRHGAQGWFAPAACDIRRVPRHQPVGNCSDRLTRKETL